jgi:hypothetical protein
MARRSSLLAPALALALLAPSTIQARTRDFDRIVDKVAERYHKRPGWGCGLLSFLGRCFTPSGVHGLRMAYIEDAPEVPAESLDGFVEGAVGSGFRPFVKVRSTRDHECVHIYTRELGREVELLLVSLEPREAVVLQMRLEPEAFQAWLHDPEGMARKNAR